MSLDGRIAEAPAAGFLTPAAATVMPIARG
jgi:hypothetical protein